MGLCSLFIKYKKNDDDEASHDYEASHDGEYNDHVWKRGRYALTDEIYN